MNREKQNYMPQLDSLRTFAVAAVAYSHWVPIEYHFGMPFGYGGVQLFFVLSGFLITGILLQCQNYDNRVHALKSFYTRRFLRIFPLFYGVLFIGLIFNVHPIRETFWWHFTYLSNFYFISIQDWHGPVSHFWSLAVEEQFYLIWPIIILFIPRKATGKVVVATIALGIISNYGLRYAMPDIKLILVLPTSGLVSLGLGATLACHREKLIDKRFITIIAGGLPIYFILLILESSGTKLPLHTSLQDFCLMLGFTWLVHRASIGFTGIAGKVLCFPALMYLGKISYGLYVLHNFSAIPVSVISQSLGVPSIEDGISGLILKTSFTIAAASLSWHFFERPICSLKYRFPYSFKPENRTLNVQVELTKDSQARAD